MRQYHPHLHIKIDFSLYLIILIRLITLMYYYLSGVIVFQLLYLEMKMLTGNFRKKLYFKA